MGSERQWELGFGQSPARGHHLLRVRLQLCTVPACPQEAALTSHAPVDGVHAVVVEEVCAGCLQGRQSQAGLRHAHLCLPKVLTQLLKMPWGWELGASHSPCWDD